MSETATSPPPMLQNGASPITRRDWIKRVAGSIIGAGVGVGLYSWRVEPHWVEIVHKEMPIANLPQSLNGKTLVQISDIHIGRHVDDEFLIAWFRRIAEGKPDIVAFTGDFLTIQQDHSIPAEQMKRVLSYFPHGHLATVGILGNHDYGYRWKDELASEAVVRIAENSGIKILRNAAHTGSGLQIVGFDDYWGPNFGGESVLNGLDLNLPTLALCHNPDVADLPIWSNYRGWILSGHTHGGQCKLPFFSPPSLPIRNKRYSSGEFLLADGRRLYVNRALGHSIRVRFNVRPEVTVFRLTNEVINNSRVQVSSI